LVPAYQVSYRTEFTDEASVVEAAGREVHLIQGEARNLKITQPDDLITATQWLQAGQ
jgi:2-C-methyl-D-erythritol 4-phosphate cytidylyltransferase